MPDLHRLTLAGLSIPISRETVLAALKPRLSALPAADLRGDVLPERIPAEGFLNPCAGEPGEPGVALSPRRYRYQRRDRGGGLGCRA